MTIDRNQKMLSDKEQAIARFNRRQFLQGISALGAATLLGSCSPAAPAPTGVPTPTPLSPTLTSIGKDGRLIVHGLEPTKVETPAHLFEGLTTSNDLFFVRTHDLTPDIPKDAYQLRIHGLVDEPFELTYDELRDLPSQTITGFLECSGDSRARFDSEVGSRASGTQWGNGAIGNAAWTGVLLSDLLDRAGVQSSAIEVKYRGGDGMKFERGLPLNVIGERNVMVAYGMNGTDIPAVNGGPVRMWVPGWGGVASVKWVTDIELVDQSVQNFYNTERYILAGEGQSGRSVTVMPVKSIIVDPQPDSSVASGAQSLRGYAWSGHGGIERVEVSVDDGQSWEDASLEDVPNPESWVPFTFQWEPSADSHTLLSRATDVAGNTQPLEITFNRFGYEMNAVYSVPVTVGI